MWVPAVKMYKKYLLSGNLTSLVAKWPFLHNIYEGVVCFLNSHHKAKKEQKPPGINLDERHRSHKASMSFKCW